MPGVPWYSTQVFGTSFAPQELSFAGHGSGGQVAPNMGLKEQGVDPPNTGLLPKVNTEVVRGTKMGQNQSENVDVKLENYLKLFRAWLQAFGV